MMMTNKHRTKSALFWMALYVLGMDYHSGQTSRGYRMMCFANKRLRCYYNFDFIPQTIKDAMYVMVRSSYYYNKYRKQAKKTF